MIEILSPLTNFILVFRYSDTEHLQDTDDIHIMRYMCAGAIALMWYRLIRWMRLFDDTAFYTKILSETLSDSLTFLILFFLVMGLFANLTYIFNIERLADRDENELIIPIFDIPFLDAIYGLYINTIGEYEKTLEQYEGNNSRVMYVLFFIATFLIQITFLNMLIAVMGNTFDQVSANKALIGGMLTEKIEIMSEYRVILSMFRPNFRYFFIIKPANENL